MSPVLITPLKVVNRHRKAKQLEYDKLVSVLNTQEYMTSLSGRSYSYKLKILSLTMSLSDILEILAMSRLIAI